MTIKDEIKKLVTDKIEELERVECDLCDDEAVYHQCQLHMNEQIIGSHTDQEFRDIRDKYKILQYDFEAIKKVIDEQSEDDGLWFKSRFASEKYLQQEILRLHAVILKTQIKS